MPAIVDKGTTPEDRFVAAFNKTERLSLNGSGDGLQALRKEAIERFAALGFPARKAEAWKYTNIGKILKRPYAPAFGPSDTSASASVSAEGKTCVRSSRPRSTGSPNR